MINIRILVFALFFGAPLATACTCATTGSHCDWLHGTEIVLVGRVTEDSGEGLGQGPAKMLVEEVLHGLSKEKRELTVDTGAGTSCYMRLQKDERYVIYGRSVPGAKNRINREWCSFSFRVAGNEMLLSALQQAETGANPRLVGKVQMKYEAHNLEGEGAQGVPVLATIGNTKLETLTNSNGEFEFLNVVPGQYHLQVASADLFEDEFRWPKEDPRVSKVSCGYQNLFVWPNGRIQGRVIDPVGKPVQGVPVQVFVNDRRGKLGYSPLRTSKTDEDGRYEISGLPPNGFVIGVNGEEYHDRIAWPPTFYPGTRDRDSARRIHLDRGQSLTGIDLQLPPARTPAVLHIEAVFEDGSPALGAGANVENLSGVERAFALGDDQTNVLAVPVYFGEFYKVRSSLYAVKSAESIEAGNGKIRIKSTSWSGVSDAIEVTAPDVHVRVVLRDDKR